MVSARAIRPGIVFAAASLALWSSTGQALELTSGDVANGAMLRLAQVHSRCGGENRSPALAWSGAPKGTESYAITMFDSDANGGRGFWHWIILGIPAREQSLGAGIAPAAALPDGASQPDNDFGTKGYGGACPPPGSGTHHYAITLYALPTASMTVDNKSGAAAIAADLKAHALATATVTGIYKR
jgi:Raf kinase inhibitor-like YbhB/YbcL family protein